LFENTQTFEALSMQGNSFARLSQIYRYRRGWLTVQVLKYKVLNIRQLFVSTPKNIQIFAKIIKSFATFAKLKQH
jgi:hypothetical protein